MEAGGPSWRAKAVNTGAPRSSTGSATDAATGSSQVSSNAAINPLKDSNMR